MKTNAHLGASRLQTTCGLELLELLSVLAKLQRLGRLLGNLEAVLERLNLHQIVCHKLQRMRSVRNPEDVRVLLLQKFAKTFVVSYKSNRVAFMQYIGESE